MHTSLEREHTPSSVAAADWKYDAWLSKHLGKEAYHLANREIAPKAFDKSFEWLKKKNAGNSFFADVKISGHHPRIDKLLVKSGFSLIDTAVTLKKTVVIEQNIPVSRIRSARPEDESQTVEIAQKNSRTSRFHLDPRVGQEKADRLKGEWVRNFFAGKRGDALLVAEVEGKAAGFALYIFSGDQMILDLIATHEPFRRKGIATDLMTFAEQSFRYKNHIVGTQSGNQGSLKLYEKFGFKILKKELVFHYHA